MEMFFLLQRSRPKIAYKSTPIIGRSANTKNHANVLCGDLFSIKITNEIPTIVMNIEHRQMYITKYTMYLIGTER